MEKTILEIKEKAAMLGGYVAVLERLKDMEQWYQHCDDDGNYIDDEYESAKYALSAVRETAKMVKKLAGV